jgi:hypothetical protein
LTEEIGASPNRRLADVLPNGLHLANRLRPCLLDVKEDDPNKDQDAEDPR